MELRSPIRPVLLAGALALAASGCAVAMYEGAPRPTTELSAIEADHTQIASIDGKIAPAGLRFMVLPGAHRIVLALPDGAGGQRPPLGAKLTVCATTQAGRGYLAKISHRGNEWHPEVIDTGSGTPVAISLYDPAQRRCAPGTAPPILAASAPAWEAPPSPPGRPVGWDPPEVGYPNHPGTSFDLRVTPAFGGDIVINGSANDGSKQVDSGIASTIGLTLTPLWLGDVIGLGGSAAIGWRLNRINTSGGSVLLSRFPLEASLHAMTILSERWYMRLGGGIQYDLGVSASGSGSLSGMGSGFESSLGGIGELAICYRPTRSFATDLNLRFTSIKYSSPAISIDAKDIGISFAGHYAF
jgi:hypothetical protein